MSTAAEREVLAALPDAERRRREGRVLDDYGNEVLYPGGYCVSCRCCSWQTWGTPHNLPVDFAGDFCDRADCPLSGAAK